MGYTLVKSFERGIDHRKLIETTEPGTLLDGKNCHITLGGELEKRAAFVPKMTLPAGTVGLWVTEGRVIHTWGDAATAPAGLPAGVVYHSAPDPDGSLILRIRSVEEFNSKLYVVIEYVDGHIYHWWDNAVVRTPAPEGSGGGPPPPSTPSNKPQAIVSLIPQVYIPPATPPSPDFELKAIWLLSPTSVYNFVAGPLQDAWLMIPQTGTDPATGRPIGSHILVGGFTGHSAEVHDFVAGVINASTVTTPVKMYAEKTTYINPATGVDTGLNIVRMWVDLESTLYNGWKVEFLITNYTNNGPGGQRTLAGGVTPPPSTPPAPAAPGDPAQKGSYAMAHNYRMLAVKNTQESALLNYSAPSAPESWDNPELQSGNIDLSQVTNRKPKLVSLAEYGADVAIFGERHILIYIIDVVPTGDRKRQVIHGTGTFAPHSVVPWGSSDVMYLDINGIRSLRARDSSEQAFSADLGNLIDDLVTQKIATLTADQKIGNIWGVVEPRSGRLWMALHDVIYVLNFYPSSRIAAWTYYDATEAPVDMMVTSDYSVYWRSGNEVFIYGDEGGNVFDDTEALARIPYIDAGKPATTKNWTGFDAAVLGTWTVRGSFDPTQPTALDLLATITKSTYQQQKIAVNGESPALSLEFKTTYVGPARIGNAALHYTDSNAD